MLRDTIHKEVQEGNFDIALDLVEQMADSFGNEMEDEKLRGDIFAARNAVTEQHVRDRIAVIDQLLGRHEWEKVRLNRGTLGNSGISTISLPTERR